MWTIIRFELGSRDYRTAFDLLCRAGFTAHRRPARDATGPFPAAVVRDLLVDPAAVTRVVFAALHEAGLAPVAVSAAHVDLARRPRSGSVLAPS